MPADLELTVVQEASGDRGYLAGFAITDQLILAAGGTSSRAPTVLASSNARHFEMRRTPRDLGLRDLTVIGDALWACGEYGQLATSTDHGASWSLFETGTDVCLFGVAAAKDGALWVVGDRGYAGRIVSDQIARIDLGSTARLTGVYAVRDEVVVLGGDGALRRWHDGQIATVATGTTRQLTALAITKAGTWIAIGDGGFIARSPDGSWFSRANSGVETDLEAITALQDGRLVVVGDRGQILISHDDGRIWTSVSTALTTHLWSVERFGNGALIGGDAGLIVKLAPRGDDTWRDRTNIFGQAKPLDAIFAAGPAGFIANDLATYITSIDKLGEDPEADDNLDAENDPPDDVGDDGDDGSDRDPQAFTVLGTPGTARDFASNLGIEMSGEAKQFFEIVAGRDPWNTFEELRLDSELLPAVGDHNLFELIVRRDQRAYLGTGLIEAFCGVFCIGSQGNGDTYHLEIYGWDGPPQVLHWDHETHAFSHVFADSLDSLVYLAGLARAEGAHLVSTECVNVALQKLSGKVAPTWHFEIVKRAVGFVELDAKRRETEFFHYRARWICALLKNDGVTDVADIPGLFVADLNQILPAEQLETRLEMCERYIPTALYSMWRAYLFDEPELSRYLEISNRHKAGIVRDAAKLIGELRAGRNRLGSISDWSAHLRAFRALDLDPRRAGQRAVEQQARGEVEAVRRAEVVAALDRTPRSGWTDLAWRWIDDGVAHRALLARLDALPAEAAQITALDELRELSDSDREATLPQVAAALSPELEVILVGSLVRDDQLVGEPAHRNVALADRSPRRDAPASPDQHSDSHDDVDLRDDHDDGDREDEGESPDPARVLAALGMTGRALSLAPDDPDAQFTHAMLLVDAHRRAIAHKMTELIATLPRFAPCVRVNVAVRLAKLDIDEFVDAVDVVLADELPKHGVSTYVDVTQELFSDLGEAILERAPDRMPKLVPLLPEDVALLSNLAFFAVNANQLEQSIAIYDRLLTLPIPDHGAERTSYLRSLNNACIQTHAAGAYATAVRIADRAQPVAHENPHIFHAAACAYVGVGDYDRALAQVKLAFEHDYEHLERLETDTDLGPLLDSAEVKILFRDWHARREGN